jgi:amphi-Trp domain-containing protein
MGGIFMHATCNVLGVITVLDGLFTTVFAKNYIRGFYGAFNFGPEYKNLINAYSVFSDRAIRIIGLSELALGIGLLAPNMKMRSKTEIEEDVSKENFSKILRGLADSLESSRDFQTVIKGQQVYVPAQANMKVEYEQKETGGELELEVKWEGAA